MRIFDFLRGWFETTGDNETRAVSTIADPCKDRKVVKRSLAERNLGGESYGLLRDSPESNGEYKDDELVYTGGQCSEDKQEGGWFVALLKRGGNGVEDILHVNPQRVFSHVPIYAPNIPGPGGGASGGLPPNELVSPSDKYRLSIQDDGQFVIYRMNPDGGGVPVWSSAWVRMR